MLENHGNGDILDSVDKMLSLIKIMTWKGIRPIIYFLEKSFEKGIRLTKKNEEI